MLRSAKIRARGGQDYDRDYGQDYDGDYDRDQEGEGDLWGLDPLQRYKPIKTGVL